MKRERERATTVIQKSFCIWETFKLPVNDTTKGKLSNTQCKERQQQKKRGEARAAAGVNFTLTNNEENNAVNRNENRTVFLYSPLYAIWMLRMTKQKAIYWWNELRKRKKIGTTRTNPIKTDLSRLSLSLSLSCKWVRCLHAVIVNLYLSRSHYSPLLMPVALSRSTLIECTAPYSSNISRNCASSIDLGTWPTNILILSGSGSFSP